MNSSKMDVALCGSPATRGTQKDRLPGASAADLLVKKVKGSHSLIAVEEVRVRVPLYLGHSW